MFSIIISGYIPIQKSKEFRQHMRQLIGQQDNELVDVHVLQDMMNEELYLVKVTFKDEKSMFSFLKTEDFAAISGSFKVLGMLREQHFETHVDFKAGHKLTD